jgi:hypothetical protein
MAVREEVRVREAIVLEDDGPVDGSKDPIQAAADAPFAAEVRIRVVAYDLAWPVDVIDDSPNLLAALRVGRMPRARTVGDQEQPRRSVASQRAEGGSRQLRPIEDDVYDGSGAHDDDEKLAFPPR